MPVRNNEEIIEAVIAGIELSMRDIVARLHKKQPTPLKEQEEVQMDIKREVNAYFSNHTEEDYDSLKAQLGHDSCKKAGAILDILEIGESSVAHAKLILRVCEDMIEKCSLTFGTKRDA